MESPTKRFKIPSLNEMEKGEDKDKPQPFFKKTTVGTTVLPHPTGKVDSSKIATAEQNVGRPAVPGISTKSDISTSAALAKSEIPANRVVLGNNIPTHDHQTNEASSVPIAPVSDTDSSHGVDDIAAGVTTSTRPGSSNSLIVNTRQRGNPILKSIRNIPWEYGNIVPDYVMGLNNCALFLSLRYHQLHPNYIHERLKLLGKNYDLRVMLVQVDVKEPHHVLKDLAKICLLADCTLILAFSPEEAGRYLETFKIFENKPPEAIMEKTEENFMAKLTDCLTKVKSVNKTDCATLISHFGSLSSIMEASEDDLSLCPGFGPQKAKRLYNIFHEPFMRTGAFLKS